MSITKSPAALYSNFENADRFYEELAMAVRDLSPDMAKRFLYTMVFCCANLVGKQTALSEAIELARQSVKDEENPV